jgi:hypothetical protein
MIGRVGNVEKAGRVEGVKEKVMERTLTPSLPHFFNPSNYLLNIHCHS